MHVFFQLEMYKSWSDPEPKIKYVRYSCFVSSEKDFETLQKMCLEKTKDSYVSARVEHEMEKSISSAMTDEEFFRRLAVAYLAVQF